MSTHNTPALFDTIDMPADRPPIARGPQWICAIDPGLDGGIALLADNEEPLRFVMPTVEVKQKGKKAPKRFYDIPAIRRILADNQVTHVFIEAQQAQTKPIPNRCRSCGTIVGATTPQGTVSTFTTGRGYGLLEGLCAGLQVAYTLVHPRSWQPKLLPPGVGDSKGRAKLACNALFPTLDLRANERCRVSHEGICDALLIGVYGQRLLRGTMASSIADGDDFPF